MNFELPLPHPAQQKILDSPERFRVIVTGRRFGKTLLAVIKLLCDGLKKKGLFWYVSPSYRQSKNIAWTMMLDLARPVIKEKNESELCLTLLNGTEIHLKGVDNEDCFDDLTEILTSKGWKLFKDLDKKEKVLTLNPVTLAAEWKKPLRYIEEDYTGGFFNIVSHRLDFMTSPRHRYLVQSPKGKIKFKTVPLLAAGDHIPVGNGLCGESGITHDEAAFMGIYLAEGTAYGNCGGDIKKRKGNYSVFIAQTDGEKGWKGNKGNVKGEIKKLLDRLGFHYRDRGDGLEILKKELWQRLIGLGNKYTKFIPEEYKELPAGKLRTMIDWMVAGDGSVRGKARVYYTASKKLADDLQEISFKAGFSAKIKIKKPCGGFIKDRFVKNKVSLYEVVLYQNKSSYFRGNGKNYIKKVHYDGKMYCVETENNTVLVRRNGKAMWSGNSLRGVGLDGIVCDEYADWKPHTFDTIIRPALTDRRGWAWFVGTPKGYNHFWELAENAGTRPGWAYFHFTSYDNPYLPAEELDYARSTGDPKYFAQEYMAEFVTFTGLVYHQFDRNRNVSEFELPPNLLYFRGLDFGADHPTAATLWGVDSQKKIWVYDEYKVANADFDAHVTGIRAKSPDKHFNATWADPSSKQAIIEFCKKGIPCVAGINDRRLGIDLLNSLLRTDKLMIHSRCTNLIYEFEHHKYKDHTGKEAYSDADVEKVNDDLIDSLRYSVCSYYAPREKLKKDHIQEKLDKIYKKKFTILS